MRPNTLRQLLGSGKTASLGWSFSADTYVAETMANIGFDALVLDMQHGMTIGPDRAGPWLQAVSTTPTVPLVRVSWNEPVFIQWVLDAGAYGVIVPLVRNGADAAKAGRACRYPPAGFRSTGPNRARYYGGQDYTAGANGEILCFVMVEDAETVERVDEVAAAPGIDGIYVGPSDLAVSMGLPPRGYLTDQRHAAACLKVLEAAREHRLFAGIHCFSPEEVLQRYAEGFQMCAVATDIGALVSGASEALRKVREGKGEGGRPSS